MQPSCLAPDTPDTRCYARSRFVASRHHCGQRQQRQGRCPRVPACRAPLDSAAARLPRDHDAVSGRRPCARERSCTGCRSAALQAPPCVPIAWQVRCGDCTDMCSNRLTCLRGLTRRHHLNAACRRMCKAGMRCMRRQARLPSCPRACRHCSPTLRRRGPPVVRASTLVARHWPCAALLASHR